jgi:hypothetical protein
MPALAPNYTTRGAPRPPSLLAEAYSGMAGLPIQLLRAEIT